MALGWQMKEGSLELCCNDLALAVSNVPILRKPR